VGLPKLGTLKLAEGLPDVARPDLVTLTLSRSPEVPGITTELGRTDPEICGPQRPDRLFAPSSAHGTGTHSSGNRA
jgi:hypothetical protein